MTGHDEGIPRSGRADQNGNDERLPVVLLGGPFNLQHVRLSDTPPRVDVGGVIYEQVTDPDTGAFLGAYITPPGAQADQPDAEQHTRATPPAVTDGNTK